MKVEVIDFYADWCNPCKAMSPEIKALQEEFVEGNEAGVTITKINVDSEPEMAKKYNVRSIPTLVFLKEGVEKERSSGTKTKDFIKERINDLLLNN